MVSSGHPCKLQNLSSATCQTRSGRSRYELQLVLYLLAPTKDPRVTKNSKRQLRCDSRNSQKQRKTCSGSDPIPSCVMQRDNKPVNSWEEDIEGQRNLSLTPLRFMMPGDSSVDPVSVNEHPSAQRKVWTNQIKRWPEIQRSNNQSRVGKSWSFDCYQKRRGGIQSVQLCRQ